MSCHSLTEREPIKKELPKKNISQLRIKYSHKWSHGKFRPFDTPGGLCQLEERECTWKHSTKSGMLGFRASLHGKEQGNDRGGWKEGRKGDYWS